MAEKYQKEFVDRVDDYKSEESDPEPEHVYDFDWEWDEDKEKIILKAKDKITKRKWQLVLGKESYADPSKEYDKMNAIFDDDDYELITKYDEMSGDLTVIFRREHAKVNKYKFDLPQVK